MALRIKLQSGAVLDYLDERLGDTRAGAVKAHAGGDAARAALLTAVLSQVKASVSAVVRAHCEVVGESLRLLPTWALGQQGWGGGGGQGDTGIEAPAHGTGPQAHRLISSHHARRPCRHHL